MAWELDFWGRFRRAIEAADANLDASVEAYDDVLVLLLSDVAQSYTDVRIAEERLAYAQQNIEIQRGSLQLGRSPLPRGRHDAARRDPSASPVSPRPRPVFGRWKPPGDRP